MRALGLMICYLMCFSCVEAAGNDLLSQLDEVERKIHKNAAGNQDADGGGADSDFLGFDTYDDDTVVSDWMQPIDGHTDEDDLEEVGEEYLEKVKQVEEANRKANKQPGLPAGPWGSVDPYLPTPITTTPAPTVSPSRGEDEAVLARAALTDSFQATCAQCMRCHENVRSILMMASRARQYAEPAGDEEMVEMGRAGNVDVEVEVDEETGETSAPQSMSMNNLLRKEEAEDQSVAASSPMATEVPVATSTPSIIKRKTPE